jgi:hypothetical protein
MTLSEFGYFMAVPFVIRVYFQEIALEDDKTFRVKEFGVHLDLDFGLVPDSVFPAAREVVTDDEFVKSLFVVFECAVVTGRVDRRMCLIIVLAVTWFLKLAISKSKSQ